MTHRPNAITHTQEYTVLPGVVRHTFIIFGLFTAPNLCPPDTKSWRRHCRYGKYPLSRIHYFISGSKLTFFTHLFHHRLLAPTGLHSGTILDWTVLILLSEIYFFKFNLISYFFTLGRAVEDGLIASFRAHVNIGSSHHITLLIQSIPLKLGLYIPTSLRNSSHSTLCTNGSTFLEKSPASTIYSSDQLQTLPLPSPAINVWGLVTLVPPVVMSFAKFSAGPKGSVLYSQQVKGYKTSHCFALK